MSDQTVNDVQTMIDTLFDKLDGAKSGGELTQYTHALRVQITKKKQLGGSLTAREKDITAAVGEISSGRKMSPLLMAIMLAVVIGGVYVAYRYLIHHA